MSDLADRAAESCGAVEGLRGVFAVAPEKPAFTPRRGLPACSCGGRPVYLPHPPMMRGGQPAETLACGTCGNSVGPFSSRQALAEAWRLGGWQRETGNKQ